MYTRLLLSIAAFLVALPSYTYAHEVYVLTSAQTAKALATPAFSLGETITQNLNQFVFWGFAASMVIVSVFFISISRFLEKGLAPFLKKLPPYAPFISRISIGCGLLAAAYFGALFGPELTLVDTYGRAAPFAQATLAMAGIMFIAGYYARIAASAILILFLIAIAIHGLYMLTYINYLGEVILILILGSHFIGYHHKHHDHEHAPAFLLSLKHKLTPYAFPILRICFGISLLYASLYAKVFYNNLALAVAETYPAIPAFFGFEPHFMVLGAVIVEILIAFCFIFGIEIRFAALFLEFWLFLSLWYFGESVWPHFILIGIPIAFLCYGYDKKSLEGQFMKRYGHHPVL